MPPRNNRKSYKYYNVPHDEAFEAAYHSAAKRKFTVHYRGDLFHIRAFPRTMIRRTPPPGRPELKYIPPDANSFTLAATIKNVSKRAVERSRVNSRFRAALKLVMERDAKPVNFLQPDGDLLQVSNIPPDADEFSKGYHYNVMLGVELYAASLPEIIKEVRIALEFVKTKSESPHRQMYWAKLPPRVHSEWIPQFALPEDSKRFRRTLRQEWAKQEAAQREWAAREASSPLVKIVRAEPGSSSSVATQESPNGRNLKVTNRRNPKDVANEPSTKDIVNGTDPKTIVTGPKSKIQANLQHRPQKNHQHPVKNGKLRVAKSDGPTSTQRIST